MRNSIGGLSLMNIFIVFFIIIAFILIGTVVYYKGYKINSQIINSLEKYEGYNEFSATDIDRILSSLGYRKNGNGEKQSCGDVTCLAENGNYQIAISCSRSDKNKGNEYEGNNYYITYKVKTYIYIDLPFNHSLKLPITSKSNPIYQFTEYENGMGC